MDAVKMMMIHSSATRGAHYMCIDIKDYYLNNPLERPEYVRIPLSLIPAKTLDKHSTASSRMDVCYSRLPQSGKISQDLLIKRPSSAGLHQSPDVPCLFEHATKDPVLPCRR
jgi:hypothetical protein